MAQAIVQDALAGRTDGFDRLIAANRAVLDGVQATPAPSGCDGCAQHHAQTRAVLGQSLALLTDLRAATVAGDLQALSAAQGRATALEAKARDIEALKATLIERYALC
jgi:hypothetical protein